MRPHVDARVEANHDMRGVENITVDAQVSLGDVHQEHGRPQSHLHGRRDTEESREIKPPWLHQHIGGRVGASRVPHHTVSKAHPSPSLDPDMTMPTAGGQEQK